MFLFHRPASVRKVSLTRFEVPVYCISLAEYETLHYDNSRLLLKCTLAYYFIPSR